MCLCFPILNRIRAASSNKSPANGVTKCEIFVFLANYKTLNKLYLGNAGPNQILNVNDCFDKESLVFMHANNLFEIDFEIPNKETVAFSIGQIAMGKKFKKLWIC